MKDVPKQGKLKRIRKSLQPKDLDNALTSASRTLSNKQAATRARKNTEPQRTKPHMHSHTGMPPSEEFRLSGAVDPGR